MFFVFADTPNFHGKEQCSSSSLIYLFQGPFISNMHLFVTRFLYFSWQPVEHDTTGKKSGKSTLDRFPPPQTKNVVDMFCFNSTHFCLVISFNKLPFHLSEVSNFPKKPPRQIWWWKTGAFISRVAHNFSQPLWAWSWDIIGLRSQTTDENIDDFDGEKNKRVGGWGVEGLRSLGRDVFKIMHPFFWGNNFMEK